MMAREALCLTALIPLGRGTWHNVGQADIECSQNNLHYQCQDHYYFPVFDDEQS